MSHDPCVAAAREGGEGMRRQAQLTKAPPLHKRGREGGLCSWECPAMATTCIEASRLEHAALHGRPPPRPAPLLQEGLYEEDMATKVRATGMISQLFRNTENFEVRHMYEHVAASGGRWARTCSPGTAPAHET